MGAALRELMKDEIDHGIAMGREEGRESGIKSTIMLCKKLNGGMIDAVESVVATMGLSSSEAEALVKKYW